MLPQKDVDTDYNNGQTVVNNSSEVTTDARSDLVGLDWKKATHQSLVLRMLAEVAPDEGAPVLDSDEKGPDSEEDICYVDRLFRERFPDEVTPAQPTAEIGGDEQKMPNVEICR